MAAKKTNGVMFKPTKDERKLVGEMTAVGIPQESICLVIRGGIDDKTLRKHFREELDTSATKANAGVGQTLYNKAMSGDTAAMIWWTKTRMRWSETVKVDSTVHHISPEVKSEVDELFADPASIENGRDKVVH